jgi:hypothetical protein
MRRLAAYVLLLLVPVALSATVVLPVEFRELVTTSQVIVHGHVTDTRSVYVDGRSSIQTFVTIAADDYMKGDLGDRVTFFVPGGQIGAYKTVFIGAPEFHEGDEVVLFLRRNGSGIPYVAGLSQGAFRVLPDRSGQRVVTTPVVMATGAADRQPVVRGDAARRPLPLDDFRSAVRQVLAGAGQ